MRSLALANRIIFLNAIIYFCDNLKTTNEKCGRFFCFFFCLLILIIFIESYEKNSDSSYKVVWIAVY